MYIVIFYQIHILPKFLKFSYILLQEIYLLNSAPVCYVIAKTKHGRWSVLNLLYYPQSELFGYICLVLLNLTMKVRNENYTNANLGEISLKINKVIVYKYFDSFVFCYILFHFLILLHYAYYILFLLYYFCYYILQVFCYFRYIIVQWKFRCYNKAYLSLLLWPCSKSLLCFRAVVAELLSFLFVQPCPQRIFSL